MAGVKFQQNIIDMHEEAGRNALCVIESSQKRYMQQIGPPNISGRSLLVTRKFESTSVKLIEPDN